MDSSSLSNHNSTSILSQASQTHIASQAQAVSTPVSPVTQTPEAICWNETLLKHDQESQSTLATFHNLIRQQYHQPQATASHINGYLIGEEVGGNPSCINETFFASFDLYNNRTVNMYYVKLLNGDIRPFLALLTIITNILVAIVLAQRTMRTPTNLVLLAMSIADLLTTIFPAPWDLYLYTFGHHNEMLYPSEKCLLRHYMEILLPTIFHTTSMWLTLILAAQRYIYVCHPTVAPKWCTVPKVTYAIVGAFGLSLIINILRFFENFRNIYVIDPRGHIARGCLARMREPWEQMIFPYYVWFRIIFVNICSCVVLVILNFKLFSALRQAQKTRARLITGTCKNERERDTNRTTLMLIVVVTMFLVIEIPNAIILVLLLLLGGDDPMVNLMSRITNLLITASHPFNFAIYCGMSRQFRETFKILFIPGVKETTKSSSVREGSTRFTVANGRRTSTPETDL
ncbi:sex peptide receptor-like isoform X2 [Brevipalpus obovatus]